MAINEYLGKQTTVDDVLAMAEAEGAELGVRQGRITIRGTSPALGWLIKEHEKELVERLGGKFHIDFM